MWNKLSTDCVHASSVNMFKNKIDKYLVKAGYTHNKGRLHLCVSLCTIVLGLIPSSENSCVQMQYDRCSHSIFYFG